MKRYNILVSVLLAVLFVFSSVNAVTAANTSEAKEKIDASAECSLNLTYKDEKDGSALEGLAIELYMVASADGECVYTLVAPFDGFKIEINRLQSRSEWDAVTTTVGSYITADGIKPQKSTMTGTDGKAGFAGLKPGMYFVKLNKELSSDDVHGFPSFIIAVPGLSVDGKWLYDVDAVPKPGGKEEIPESYRVVKYWNDRGNREGRGDGVTIDICKDGSTAETVVLNDSNNWTYDWKASGGSEWTVVERNVPEGYSVTIEKNGNVFEVTNTDTSKPAPPYTGDTGKSTVWIILMIASGVLLTALGIFGRTRKRT